MNDRLNWKWVVAASLLILLAPQVLGFLSGLSMKHWEFYGDTTQAAIANARTTRFIAIGVVSYLIYLTLRRSVRERRVLHAMIVFCAAELLALVVEMTIWRAPLSEAVYWPATIRHFVAGLLALGSAAALPETRDH